MSDAPIYLYMATLIGAGMVILTAHEYAKGKLRFITFLRWEALWLIMIFTALLPDYYAPITSALGMSTPILFVLSFSTIVLFIFVLEIYRKLDVVDQKLAIVGEKLAIEDYKRHREPTRS